MNRRRLSLAEQPLNTLGVSFSHFRRALQATSTGGRLAFEEVAAVRLLATELARTGYLYTLCGALVGLLLHEI